MTTHIVGPFGGCDENAETSAFEEMIGGPTKAFRLMNILRTLGRSSETNEKDALRQGYTKQQIAAWKHL